MQTRAPKSLLFLGALVAVVVCLPLVYLVVRATGDGWQTILEVLGRPKTLSSVGLTVSLGASVAGAGVAIGVPIAWWITRAGLRMRGFWIVCATLPLAVPSFVAAFSWVAFIPNFNGFFAAWLVLTLSTVPYIILPTAAAMRGVDPAHEEVARTLGLGPIASFRRAALPQLWPAVGGGALLACLYVFSDFGAVSILRVDTLSRAIYSSYRASFDRTSAAILALLLVLLALLVVWIEQRVRGRAQRWRLATSAPRAASVVYPRVGWRIGAYALLIIVVGLGVLLPIVVSIIQMISGSSLRLDFAELLQAVGTTVFYGVVGMIAAMVLAIPVGLLAARYRTRSALVLERVSFVGHALPGVVVGLSVVFVATRLTPALYQTVAILALAYAILFLPKAGAAIRGSIAGVPPVLEDVARTLGCSPQQAFMRTTFRLALPGVLAGAVLVLLTVMKELPATLMLRPTGQETLATQLWSFTTVSAYAAAAPYALALILIGAIPAAVLAVPLVRAARMSDASRYAPRVEEVSA